MKKGEGWSGRNTRLQCTSECRQAKNSCATTVSRTIHIELDWPGTSISALLPLPGNCPRESAYCMKILDLKDGNQLEAYALGSLGGDLNDVSLWPRQSTLDVVRIHFCVQGLVLPSFPKVPLPNERQSKCGGWTIVSWIAVDIMAASNTSCFFPQMSALNAPCLISHVSRSYLARLCGPDLDSWGV